MAGKRKKATICGSLLKIARRPRELRAPKNCLFRSAAWLGSAAHSSETFLELVDATFGIDKLFLPREKRMRIGGDPHRNNEILHTVDRFLFVGFRGGARDILVAGRHVLEDDRMIFWMSVFFHGTEASHDVSNAGTRNMEKFPPLSRRDAIFQRKKFARA